MTVRGVRAASPLGRCANSRACARVCVCVCVCVCAEAGGALTAPPEIRIPWSAGAPVITCILDQTARTFACAVGSAVPQVMYRNLPAGVTLFPVVYTAANALGVCLIPPFRYQVPHIGWALRTRILCQAGRAHTVGARSAVAAWLCERAPLWVVVRVCALLREE